MGNIFRDNAPIPAATGIQIDRKRLQELQRKRIALGEDGHAAGDRRARFHRGGGIGKVEIDLFDRNAERVRSDLAHGDEEALAELIGGNTDIQRAVRLRLHKAVRAVGDITGTGAVHIAGPAFAAA